MRINGSYTVLLGALMIWLHTVTWTVEAYGSFLVGDYGWAAFRLLGAIGSGLIGWRVARTEG